MAKAKKAKKVTGKRDTRLTPRQREIARQVRHFVYWRQFFFDDEAPMKTKVFIDTWNPMHIDPRLVEHTLNHSDVRYHCITISYCRDPWGKQYKLFGYAATEDTLIVVEHSLAPLIKASRGYAEQNANLKHVIGHAVVITPRFGNGVKIGDVCVKLRKELDLDDKELKALKECIEGEYRTTEVERRAPRTVDEEIAELLKD